MAPPSYRGSLEISCGLLRRPNRAKKTVADEYEASHSPACVHRVGGGLDSDVELQEVVMVRFQRRDLCIDRSDCYAFVHVYSEPYTYFSPVLRVVLALEMSHMCLRARSTSTGFIQRCYA